MEKNEIKKALYKQKPKAKFFKIKKGIVIYLSTITVGEPLKESMNVYFEIDNLKDMGDADLLPEMDAQLLIRYLA